MNNKNIYNLKPHKRIPKSQLSITLDAVVKSQLEHFCSVTGFNRSEAIEAILSNYFKPILSEGESDVEDEEGF